jgi:hypothetical protein
MFVQIDRVDAAGNTCVESVLAEGISGKHLFSGVFAPHDPGKAWLLRPIKLGKFEARPMACTVH